MAPTPEVASIVRRISLFMKPKYQFSGIVPTRYSSPYANDTRLKIEVRADDLVLTFDVQRLNSSGTMQIRRGAYWVPLPELPSSSCYGAREGAASDTCFTCADVIASYKEKKIAYYGMRKDFKQCNPNAPAYVPRTTAPGSTPAPANVPRTTAPGSTPAPAVGTLAPTQPPAVGTLAPTQPRALACPVTCGQAKGANPKCSRWLSTFGYCGDEATFGKGFNDAGLMTDCRNCA
jgi:hypothetical protein